MASSQPELPARLCAARDRILSYVLHSDSASMPSSRAALAGAPETCQKPTRASWLCLDSRQASCVTFDQLTIDRRLLIDVMRAGEISSVMKSVNTARVKSVREVLTQKISGDC